MPRVDERDGSKMRIREAQSPTLSAPCAASAARCPLARVGDASAGGPPPHPHSNSAGGARCAAQLVSKQWLPLGSTALRRHQNTGGAGGTRLRHHGAAIAAAPLNVCGPEHVRTCRDGRNVFSGRARSKVVSRRRACARRPMAYGTRRPRRSDGQKPSQMCSNTGFAHPRRPGATGPTRRHGGS